MASNPDLRQYDVRQRAATRAAAGGRPRRAPRRPVAVLAGLLALAVVAGVVYVQLAAAAVTITQGNATATADQANAGTWVTLAPNIVIAEGANGDFGNNGNWGATNVTLTPPAGWQFNAGQTITPTFAGGNITGATATVAAGGTSLTLTLTGSGRNSADSVTLPSVQVRPTATTPLATGTIGCSSVNRMVGITCGTTVFGTLTETAGALNRLTITSVPGSATAASNFSVTVRSTDAYGNPVNVGSATGIQLVPSGTGTISGNTGTIAAGTSTVTLTTVQYTKAESLTLIAQRTSGAALADSPSSSPITVNPGAFTKLQLLVPGETANPGSASGKTGTPSAQTAGSAFTVTVNAVDANWNLVSSATDTVGITSSDANATLPANAALVAGTRTFSVTLRTAGSRTVTATDVTDGTKTASTSPAITVNAGAFARLQLLVPGETAAPGSASGKTGTPSAQTAGSAFTVTVNAVDANWNPVASTDTVGITSSDANATLPPNAALVAGTRTFSLTLKTAGSWTATATDISDGTKTASSSPAIAVNPGPFAKLQLLVPGETANPGSATGKTGTPSAQTAGTAFTVTVNAVDANWNLVSSATDTVGISSTDPAATLPPNAALAGGTQTFGVTLNTPGLRTLTATDVTDGTKASDTSPAITVVDTIPPTFVSATVNGTSLVLTFSEALDATSTPAGSAFAVVRNGSAMGDPTGVSIAGTQVTLTLAATVRNGDTVTVAYTQPGANRLRDVNANDAASFGAQAVSNTTPSLPPDVPALVSPADGARIGTATPTLTAGFSDTDTNNTGTIGFRVCSDSSCSGVLATFNSAGGIANGANGSAAVPGGTLTADGTYYWQARATDNTALQSGYSASRSFVLDTTPPALSSAAVNGTSLSLTYAETLDAGSTPASLAYGLHANGGAPIAPTAVSISGTAVTLTFAAGAVRNGDAVTLDYTAGGAPVQDTVGNDAGNLSGQAVTNSTPSVDPDVPAYVSPAAGARVDTTTPTLTATFSDVDTQNTGQLTFQLCSDAGCGTVLATFSSTSGIANGSNGSASVPGGAIPSDGTYHWRARATDNTSAQSAYGATRTLVVDTAPPTFASAGVNGSTLTITMNEPLDSGSTPAGSAFTVDRNGSAMADPTGVSVSGSQVTLTLAAAVRNGDTVTVAYAQPGTNRLQDVAGNDAPGFGAQAVTNSTPSVAPDVPAQVSPANGAALATWTPTLTATFSDSDTNNTGQITFRVCSDAGCAGVLGSFDSASGLANGANGSAAVPAGTITVDGTYYWQARATDNAAVQSAFSGSRSFSVDTGPPPVPTIDSGPAGGSTSGPNVSFAFSDAEPGVTFEVRLDGGSWATDVSPKAYSGLSDGSHTFEVRAKDAFDNTSAAASRTWTVDAVAPPAPTVDSGPAGGSTSGPSVSFGFSDAEPGVSFEVRLDGGSWSGSASPKSYAGLGQGTHTFDVRALDSSGNASTPASRTWDVDATPPTVSITSPAAGANVAGTVGITSSAGDTGGSGLAGVVYEYKQSSGSSWTATPPSWNTAALTDGDYDLRAIATDNAGNSTTSAVVANLHVDNNAPTVTLTAPQYVNASDPASIGLTASSPDGDVVDVKFYECSNSSTNCSTGTWNLFATDGAAPYSASWTAPGADGNVALRARATDTASNTGDDVENVLVDRTAPAGGNVSYADGYDTDGSVAISTSNGTDSGSNLNLASAALQRDETSLAANSCSLPFPDSWSAVSAPDATVQSARCYRYRYRIADNAGNVATYTNGNVVKVDLVEPAATLDDPGPYLRGTVSLSATTSDAGGSGIASTTFQYFQQAAGGPWSAVGTPGAWDTTTAATPDGLYDLRVVVVDNAGNQKIHTVASRRIDNTPPGATLDDPGPYLRGTITFTSTSGDPGGSGVASVAYERSPAGAGSWAAFANPWTTTPADDGLYDFRVSVTDNAGNTGTSSPPLANVRVDNTPPTVSMTNPASGTNVTATISVSAASADTGGSGVASVEFQRKLTSGGPWTSLATDTTAPYSVSFDTTTVTDDQHDFRAISTDNAGNTTTSAVAAAVRVDNQAPTVAYTSPTSGQFVNAASPDPRTLAAAANDAGSGVAGVEFFACSNVSVGCTTGSWISLGAPDTSVPYEGTWALPADGNRALRAVVTDNVGRTASSIVDVTVDRTLPDTSLLTTPGNPSNVAAPPFTFDSNEAGSTFECRIDAGAWAPCSSPHTPAPLADGNHTFDVRAIDAAGNTDGSAATWTWLVDLTPPIATLDNPGANVRGTVNLTSTQSDPGAAPSGIAAIAYEYSADGTTWAATPAAWDTTLVTDGVYQLHVVVTDNAGNSTTSAAVTNVRVDNAPPATAIDDPGANLRQTVNLTGSADDGTGSGVAQVEFQISPAGLNAWSAVGTASSSPYAVPLVTTGYGDGLYDVRTVATDVAGNVTYGTPVVNRRIDNTPPSASIANPGSPLRGLVSLSSTSDDSGGSGVASVVYEASKNGGAYAPVAQNWNTGASGDGSYTLHVVVTDVAGNVTTSAAVGPVTVDNTAPVTTDNAPAGWQNAAVTVTLSANDGGGSGVGSTRYSLDGGSEQTGTSVVVPAVDGAHTISYYSVDSAGNVESQKSATVLMQATPPSCPGCTAADYLRGTVTLGASPQTTGAPITQVEFLYQNSSGGPIVSIGIDPSAPYAVDWDTTSVPDAAYDLVYRVTDAANNTSQTTIGSRVVDNTAPTAAVGSPAAGSLVTGTVTFGASVVDANLASVDYHVDGSLIGSTGGGSVSWNTNSVADGNHSLHVVVTDRAGNSTTSASITVTVDNNAPTVSLDAPATASGTVTLTATASPDTTNVDFERRTVPGGSWTPIASDATSPYSVVLNTTTLPDGDYELRAIATDQALNSTASAVRATKIDNTAPSGTIATPSPGATVGGNVSLTANASDATSGVASVAYQQRPTGGTAWSSIGSSTSAPYGVTWSTAGLASGSYELRIVVTDAAGNSFTGSPITVSIDATAPGIELGDPGAVLSGSVTLNATTTGSGANRVTFAISRAGASSWTDLGSDTSEPWSLAFDTAQHADGAYDLRATVTDTVGNSQSSVRANVLIDNTAPALVSSRPEEGAVVPIVDQIVLTVSEPLAAIDGALLDGVPTVPPVLGGSRATFNTGAVAAGAHTLRGSLRDAAGKTGPFVLHFTVQPAGVGGLQPVETNTDPERSTTLLAPGGGVTVTMPAGAWTGAAGDWLVLRIDPLGTPASLAPGLSSASAAVDVTARWALAGTAVHRFSRPIHILFADDSGRALPMTRESGGRWRHILPLSGGDLAAGADDGFSRDAAGVHVLTMHLTEFTLVHDVEPPSAPSGLRGTFDGAGLTVHWQSGRDNTGLLGRAVVLADGTPLGGAEPGQESFTIPGVGAADTRAFTVVQTDLAGNESARPTPLRVLPDLTGLTPEQARAALAARGFSVGSVTSTNAAGVQPGTVVSPAGLGVAPEGAAVDLAVAAGGQAKLAFTVVGTRKVTARSGGTVAARIVVSKRASVTAALHSPHGKKLATWRFTVRAGVSIVKLKLPPAAAAPGLYRLAWVARSGAERLARSIVVQVVPKGAKPPSAKGAEIVVAADASTRTGLAVSLAETRLRVVGAADENAAFSLAGSPARNVQLLVVDADMYSLSLVHDLRVVFPKLELIALTDDAEKLSRAVASGATIALPRSTAPSELAKVARQLLAT